MNWIKTNWFRIAILIVLVGVVGLGSQWLSASNQKELSVQQEKCRVAGAKDDAQLRSSTIALGGPESVLTLPQTQYIYSQKLNTCVGIRKYVSPADSDISRMDIAVYDEYGAVAQNFMDCHVDTSLGRYHLLKDGVMGEITENVHGEGNGSDKVTDYKTGDEDHFWKACADAGNDLIGISSFNSQQSF